MSDRLYLSVWLEQHSTMAMHRQFTLALQKFPFSTQLPQAYLRISAVSEAEPALLEQVFEIPAQMDDLLLAMEQWKSADAIFEIEAFWDLWQELPEGWRLKPSRVNHFFYGPEYRSELGESIRSELGIETLFLPGLDHDPKELHFFRSNIKSLLRLANDWGSALRVKDRRVWSESGEDFPARLQLSTAAMGREN